jgi:hypothetical protein
VTRDEDTAGEVIMPDQRGHPAPSDKENGPVCSEPNDRVYFVNIPELFRHRAWHAGSSW